MYRRGKGKDPGGGAALWERAVDRLLKFFKRWLDPGTRQAFAAIVFAIGVVFLVLWLWSLFLK